MQGMKLTFDLEGYQYYTYSLGKMVRLVVCKESLSF